MAGPWEKYAQAPAQNDATTDQDGPWEKYQTPAVPQEPGLLSQTGQAVLSGITKAGEAIDSVSGAPTRAALSSLQDDPSDLGAAAGAFKKQFGADPATAPTGKAIAARAGLSTDSLLSPGAQKLYGKWMKINPLWRIADQIAPGTVDNVAGASPAGIAGIGINAAADPLTWIPVGKIAEGAAGATKRGLEGAADRLWIKATGATGKEAAKFAPDTADAVRQVGRFGDGPAQIAGRAQAAMDAAEESKQGLFNGPLQGVTVDRNAIYNAIQGKIAELSGDESKLGIVKQLDSKLEDITGIAHRDGAAVPLPKSEEIRRGFDAKAKWNGNSDADTIEANKILANIYRQAGEDAASAVSPELGAKFKANKTTQSLLIPVQKAAEARASTLHQSPHGGLLDMAALGAGAEVAGPAGAAAGFVAKQLRPRFASMGASTADQLAKAAPAVAAGVTPSRVAALGAHYADQASGQPAAGQVPSQLADRTPSRGPQAWAQIGIQRLGLDADTAARVMQDPRGVELLHQASNYVSSSKALKQIMDQINSKWGSK